VRPILFRIPIPWTDHTITLYGYGAMLCLGFLAAILVAARRTRRLGQSPDIIYNAALFAFLGGVFGARLFYVLQYREHFTSIWSLVAIWEGGLTYYGGLVLATVSVVAYLLVSRLPVLYWLDVIAPSLPLGLAFGRMGCLLNGCCYGATCEWPWGIAWSAGSIPWAEYADTVLGPQGAVTASLGEGPYGAVMGAMATVWHGPHLHPSQVYAIVNALLLFVVLQVFFRHKRRHGQVLLLFVLLYGVSRFLMEFLRSDEASAYLLGVPTLLRMFGAEAAAGRLGGLTISQNVAIVMVAAAAVGLAILGRSRRAAWQVAADANITTAGAAQGRTVADHAGDVTRPTSKQGRKSS